MRGEEEKRFDKQFKNMVDAEDTRLKLKESLFWSKSKIGRQTGMYSARCSSQA